MTFAKDFVPSALQNGMLMHFHHLSIAPGSLLVGVMK